MGVNIFAYAPSLNNAVISKVLQRFADFGLAVELHPDIVISDGLQTEYWELCFKLRFCKEGPKEIIGKDLLTFFEFCTHDFDYDAALSDRNDCLRAANQPNLLQKLAGKTYEPITVFADGQNIDARLKQSKRAVEIELRRQTEELLGVSFASVVADLTDGVYHNADSGEYLLGKDAVARIPELIRNTPSGLDWVLFEGWPD